MAKKKTVVRRHLKRTKTVKRNGEQVSKTVYEEPGPDEGTPKIGKTPVGGRGRGGGKIVRRKTRRKVKRVKRTVKA